MPIQIALDSLKQAASGTANSATFLRGDNAFSSTITNPTLTLQNENVSPFIGFRNRIINGGFDIWQRGTSFSNVNDTYTADRFLVVPGGGTTGDSVSQQSFSPGQTDVPGEPTYFLRYTAGSTSSNKVMHHRIEDVRTGAGKTCTLSFYAKASIAHNSSVELQQNFGSGGSSSVSLSPVSYSMTTSWQKFTFNFSVPSISGKSIGTSSYVYIAFIRSLPASNLNIDIAQMQFEEGSVATSFDRRPFGTELALCQRYYQKSYAQGTVPNTVTAVGCVGGVASSANYMPVSCSFPVVMRNNATITIISASGTNGSISASGNVDKGSSFVADQPSDSRILAASGSGAALTAGTFYYFHFVANGEL